MTRVSTATLALEQQLETYRVELTAYCYRMLGSVDAEDAVQETFIRAWRAYDRFEGRSALRSWLYRIATNVCFDMLDSRKRRARPMDLGPSGAPIVENLRTPDQLWIEPMPDSRVVGEGDPAEITDARESVRLAFVAALQHLPPRQRAVLILCEVLRWKASEVAELLETSVASVNSALQRARATLEASDATPSTTAPSVDSADEELLRRYVAAFEQYDMDALTSLIHEDATQSMPPFDLWLTGRDDIFTWWFGPGNGCRGLARHPRGVGERRAGVRPVQAARRRRGLRAVGATGARDRERTHRRAHLLPRHRHAVPALRASARVRRVAPPVRSDRTCVRPMSSTSSRSGSDAFCRRTAQPRLSRRELETRERVDRHRIRVDARHVAVDDDSRALSEHCADAIAQPRKIGATDRAADGEGDLVRPRSGHRSLDGRNSGN